MFDQYAKTGLIEAEALHSLITGEHADKVVLFDASFYMPASGKDGYAIYKDAHIPEAQYFDLDEIADPLSDLPHMLPSVDDFTHHAQNFGVNSDSLVVVYGQESMVMGPARAWWMFRVFGHEAVCVLNGGLPAWRAAGYELQTLVPSMRRGNFTANYRADLVLHADDMQSTDAQILDARPPGRFNGTEVEPRPGLKRGHIQGSKNLPAGMLVDPDSQKLKSADALRALLDEREIDPNHPIATTCGSGVTACMIAFALHHLGHTDIPVYDGSWSEWGQEGQDYPVAMNS